MAIEFDCPACRRRLGVARRKSGALVECPVCAESQRVPEEIVVTSRDVVLETPPQGRLVGKLVGLFAAWGALLVIGTVLYTSRTETLAHADKQANSQNAVEYPQDIIGTKPAATEGVPNLLRDTPARELVDDSLLVKENQTTEVMKPELPAMPLVPMAPAKPPTSPAQSRDDASVIVDLPPPTLPNRTVDEKLATLLAFPEVSTTRHSRRLFITNRPQAHLTNMLQVHPDFAFLPFQPLSQALRHGEDALTLHALSRHMRNLVREATVKLPNGSTELDPVKLRALMTVNGAYFGFRSEIVGQMTVERRLRGDRFNPRSQLGSRQLLYWTALRESQANDWIDPSAVVTLLQILQAENVFTRYLLVELLDNIPGTRATSALALRAVFEVDPYLREAAILALSKRPRQDYRPILLMGLRYPWTIANENAAIALVKLKDTQAVPAVEELLSIKQPRDVIRLPGTTENILLREPVRIFHRTNCMMCHPASTNEKDLVRVVMPVEANPTPTMLVKRTEKIPTGQPYYPEIEKTTISEPDVFVRADITLLRPDFSVQLPIPLPLTKQPIRVNSSSPNSLVRERFDFTVRTRPATLQETKLLLEEPSHPGLFPNRPSLLYVLYHLDPPRYLRAMRMIKADMERNGYLPVLQEPPAGKLVNGIPPNPARDQDQPHPPGMKPDKDKTAPPVRKEEPSQMPAMKDEENKELLRLRQK